MSFEKLGVHPALAQALADEGKTTAFQDATFLAAVRLDQVRLLPLV